MYKLSINLLMVVVLSIFTTGIAAQFVTQGFSYTGAMQTWVVPPGVTSIDVDMRGAQGGAAFSGGVAGSGGRIQATLSVTSGQTLNIFIGGAGESAGGPLPISGGFNGGGDGGTVSAGVGGGGGGGASDIRVGGTALANRVLIAGGGGGAGHDGVPTDGGAGGGLIGATAANGANPSTVEATGGTQAAGGTEGSLGGFGSGFPGSLGQGGNGGVYYAGGGGGGYYGGGGGMWAGGGGGSSFANGGSATGVTHTQGFQAGNGALTITYLQCVLPTLPAVFVTNSLDRLHTLTNVNIAGSGSNASYVNPGQTVTYSFDYTIGVGGAACPGCVTQTYVGIKDEYGTCVNSYGGYCNCSGTYSNSFTAPTTPGVYYFTLGTSWLFNCGAPNAYIPNPNGSNEFAAIVVRESFSTNVTDESCVGDNDGQIVVTNDYGTTGTSYVWSTGATTPTISSLTPGTYTVTSSDSYGCYQIDTLEVYTDTTAPQAFAESSVSLILDAFGSASLTTAAVDSASTDDCPINMSIGTPILNGYETEYAFLGNYNGHSYYLSRQLDTRPNGAILAQAAGGYLATINDATENAAILAMLPNIYPFIGLSDAVTEGVYVWDNGTSPYINWNPTEPNNFGGNEDCVEMYTNGFWNDIPCATLSYHVMEFDDTVAFSSTLNFNCADTIGRTAILKVTDQGNLSSYDTTQVTISDLTSPSIIAQNLTIPLDSFGTATITADSINNGTSDNCDIDTTFLSQYTFDCSDVGINLVTFTARDVSGNISTTTVNVTVQDTLPPTLITNAVEIFLDGSGSATITPDTVDAGTWDSCGIASRSLSQSTFGCADIGLQRVLFTATDVNSNSASKWVNVLVNDTTTLAMTCIADTILSTPIDSCSKTFSYDAPTNALCGETSTLDSGLLSGSVFPLGLTRNGLSKLESSGEFVHYDFESLAPGTFHGQDNWVVSGNTTITLAQISNLPDDGEYSGGLGVYTPSLGGSNRLWMTRRNDGNWSFLPFDSNDVITIEVDMDRNFWGTRFGIGYDGNNNGSIENGEFTIGMWSGDNPGSIEIAGLGTIPLSSFSVPSTGWMKLRLTIDLKSKLVSMSYRDLTGSGAWTYPAVLQDVAIPFNYTSTGTDNPLLANAMVYFQEAGGPSQFDNAVFSVQQRESCSFNVTVIDDVVPDIQTQNVTITLDSNGQALIAADTFDIGTSDNCTLDSIWIDNSTFDCSDIGSPVLVVFSAMDSVGNTDTSHVFVTVQDLIAPHVITQPIIVNLDASGNATITAAMVNNGSWDSCGIDTMYLDNYTFDCSDTGMNTVTLFVEDVYSNTSSATAAVQVNDNVDPVVFAHDTTIFLAPNGQVSITPATIDSASADACGITLSIDTSNFSCANVGTPVEVILTGTDPSGNVSVDTAIVTILDNTPPVVLTQALNLNLDSFGLAGITPDSINNGTWDSCGIASLSIDIDSFDCSDVGTPVTVTLTATDVNGNTANNTAVVTVIDNIAPEMQAQNLTIYLDSTGNAMIDADSVDVGTNDACGIASTWLNDSLFDCSDVGAPFNITLNALDVNGNMNSVNAQITVFDTIDPIALAHNDTVYLDINGQAIITPSFIDAGSSDGCGVTLTIDTSTFDCSHASSLIPITLTATDPTGNTDTAMATLLVLDTLAPTIITQNITVQLDANGEAGITPASINNGTWDSCGIASLSIDIDSFDCSDVGTPVTVTLTATDVNGNSATGTSTVTVEDNIAPEAIAQNLTVLLDSTGNASITAAMVNNGSSDACGISSMYLSDSIFDCSDAGSVISIVLNVVDVNGNSDTAHANISIFDSIAPHIMIQNSNVYLDSFGTFSITPAFVDQGTWDSCGVLSLVLDTTNFSCASVGDTITATFTATDVNGNVSSELVDLYILDTIAPEVITQNITVQLDSFGAASITPAMINNGSWDSCQIATYVLDTSTFNCGDVGMNTVTLTVTDIHGNVHSETAIVTVEDTIAPTIIGTNLTVQLDSFGAVSITPANVSSGTWDSCGIQSIVVDSSAFSCLNVGTPVNVEITATDIHGNVSTAFVTVVVEDNIAPTIVTQNITVQLDPLGEAHFNVGMVNIGTWDSCGLDSIWLADTLLGCGDSGANNIAIYARDIHMNTDTQFVQVTVEDNLAPVLLTQDLELYLDGSGFAVITADSVDIGSSDNCDIDSIWISQDTFSCADTAATQIITFFAKDVSGNLSSQFIEIDVYDSTAPTVLTQNIVVLLDSHGVASIGPMDINNGSDDNCTIDSLWLSQEDFDCSYASDTITVTLFAKDVSGNQKSATALVYVFDSIAPQPVVQNITVSLDSFGQVTILPDTFDIGTWDSCGIAQLSLSDSTFTCGDLGTNIITFFAEDVNENVSSTTVEVTVVDDIGPTILIQNLMIYLDEDGLASVTADSVDIGTWDSCGVQSIAIDTSSFTCANHSDTLDVIFTATDVNGNVTTDTSVFIIQDTLVPNIFVHNDTFYLNETGTFDVDVSMLNDSTSDNCTLDSMFLSDTLFACDVVDSTFDITFFAVDIFGNIDSSLVTVTFLDTIQPEILCPDSIIVPNDTGACGALVSFDYPTATDNCTIDSIIQIDTTGLDSASFFPVGFTTLTYVAYDQSGNTDTCSFVIEVQDVEAPVLFCVPDTAICDTVFLFDLPAYTDNCAGLEVIQIAGIDSGAFYPVGETVNRFTIEDSYGNTDTCEFTVLRYDFPSQAEAGPDQEQCEAFVSTMAGNDPSVGTGYWSILSGTGAVTDSTLNTTTITAIEPGITTAEWRIENGVCPIERDTMTIKEFLNPTTINAGEDQVLCDTTEARLNPVLDTLGIGTWITPSNGAIVADTSDPTTTISNLALGSYTFRWQVSNGACPLQFDEMTIDVVPYPVVNITEDTVYLFDPNLYSLHATSDLPVSYLWSPNYGTLDQTDSVVAISPSESTTYIVRGTTEHGCVSADTVEVIVNKGLEIPTAFTPDGDGWNDVWNIKELKSYPNCDVKIYNRWGHLMFESQGYTTPWDGTYNGEQLPSGSYFFVIKLSTGQVKPISGSITIIK